MDSRRHTASFTAPPGGVMTREAGAVTGDLEAWLDERHPGTVRVRYAGATEAYTVSGSAPGLTLDEAVARLSTDPGLDADQNPASTSLEAPASGSRG